MIRIADLSFFRSRRNKVGETPKAKPFMESLEARQLFDAAPTATLLAPPSFNDTGQYVLRVGYADDTAINGSTIDPSDIHLVGPGGYDVSAFGGFGFPVGEGSFEGDYTFNRPTAVGTYTFVLRDNEVADEAGNFVPGGQLAQVEIVPDSQPPTATLTSSPHLNAGGTYFFDITYSDNVGVDNDSVINTQAVRVIGPHGYNQPAELAFLVRGPNGSKVATYVFSAPKTGDYTIVIDGNGVQDFSGNFVQPVTLGTFGLKASKKHPFN